MTERDIILSTIKTIGDAIAVSESLFTDFSTSSMGVKLPDTIITNPTVVAALSQSVNAATVTKESIDEIETAISTDDKALLLQSIIKFAAVIKSYFEKIDNLIQTINSAINNVSIPDAAERSIAATFTLGLAEKLTNKILVSVIETNAPKLLFGLKILGLAEWKYTNSTITNNIERNYVIKDLYLHRIKDLIKDPAQHFTNAYNWGSYAFDPSDYFRLYADFFEKEDGVILGTEGGNPFVKQGNFKMSKWTGASPPGIEITFTTSLGITDSIRFKINDSWGLSLSASFNLFGQVGLDIAPPFNFALSPPAGELSGDVKLLIDVNEDKRPYIIIGGSNDFVQLTASNISAGVALKAIWDVVHNKAAIEPMIFADIKGLTLKIGSSESDSFIANIIADADIEGSFDLGLEWLFSSGLRIKASGGIEIALPIHKQIAFIELKTIYLALKILQSGTLALEASTDLTGILGPLTVSVDRMGVKLDLSFAESNSKYGPFDLDFGFKPPNGLGLSINAGAVIGGGYLFFDFEKEEYAGAMELTIAGFISAKAIGLITTKMPDGSKGFSMLIIITAEFFPPFQLGYGFTLNGVGGLLGLHRTVLLDPLRDGVRTGAVNNIMFPTDVIANAPRIISDLKTIFPVYVGKFLIGPMAKIGWGTPSLITLSFGLIIEIPGNIAILGVLKLILPDEKVPIVKIQVAFVGTIDFDKKMLTFDASLYESSILQTMTLEGDMAVRLAWGDQPNFIMTVGGFHPSFTPPPLALPTLRRLAINILNTNIARIRVECYQAVTSNTVQFGARAEIYFDLKACSIDGHIGFDALFQFNPFYFIIELSAGFKLKAIGISLMTVRVKMSLEGPTPWHAKGTGKVSLLFFDISANFDKTWGQSKTTTLPQITILPLFLEQLQKKEQWNTVLTTGKNLTVSLRKLDEATESLLVLHPAGSLVLQQKLLPLKVNIDKIGNQKTADVKQLTIESASSGSIPLSIKEVKESFARAQYQNMSNAEKLSKPSFEKMQGGVEISMGDNSIQNGKMVRKKIKYELTIIDKEPVKPLPFGKFFLEFGVMFNHFIKGNSVSKSKLSKSTFEKLQPFEQKLDIQQELYSVAFQNNNKAFNPTATFNSEMEAQSFMQEQIKSNPNLKKQIHIVPQFELQAS